MSENCASGPIVYRWTYSPRCVGLARAELRKALAGWGLAPIEAFACVVLSELLTNALRHAKVPGREIETRYAPLWRGVRIEVHDASNALPRFTPCGPEATGGRGLPLVAALSDAWGVSPRYGAGKSVWAELTLPPAP
ncbi:ATP-binding protein [Streptomyces albipurpureus]|uniref:ATP-binding protein n=1 Tax=Streptomyces albipurpureus TaxID=2897419 RepID=A0ABT0UYL8_9ACTN|nr:ATP-binding protein [Streptomyces sp. CWNU-1]MCM2392246.1 ATP-binding protein [Streptomyces sp. CWNU-1]